MAGITHDGKQFLAFVLYYIVRRVGGGGGDSFFYFGAETFRLRNEQGQSFCLYFNEKATQFIKILDIVKKKLILFI